MDTGAQLSVGPIQLLHHLGVKRETIFPIAMGVNGASKAPLMVEGAILLKFSGMNHTTGKVLSTRQLVYISSSVDQVYLSKAACIDLGMIPADFPSVGSCSPGPEPSPAMAAAISAPGKCSNSGVLGPDDKPCSFSMEHCVFHSCWEGQERRRLFPWLSFCPHPSCRPPLHNLSHPLGTVSLQNHPTGLLECW